MNHKMQSNKAGRTARAAMMLLSTLTLMLPATGCKTRVVEIPTDRFVRTVKAGEPFTPPCAGKFVPDARFNELRDAYILESFRK